MNRHANMIQGLRDMADFLEARPDMKVGYAPITLNLFPDTIEEVFDLKPGTLEKDASSSYFFLRKRFGEMVQIEWNKPRDAVCKRVVTGTKQVTKPIMEKIGEETVTEEIVEWKCPESILDPSERPTKLHPDTVPS